MIPRDIDFQPTDGGLSADGIDDAVFAFERAWQAGAVPSIERFVPPRGDRLRARTLVELVKVDQERRWAAGDHRRLEAYLADWPELAAEDDVIVELLRAECLTRAVHCDTPRFQELRRRFPRACERIPLSRIVEQAKQEGLRASVPSAAGRSPPAPQRDFREPAMSLLCEQQTVRGTYEVERLLGQGAFAEVYRVKHRFLGRQAMKVFKMVGMTIEEIEEMLGEALMLSRIGHPNIVRVFDANTTDTSRGICGFFTMEYVAGGNLDQFWRSHGNRFVPVETAVELVRQVCRGLAVAHGEKPPIVHRDIKPQNILVGYDVGGLRARLTDFGLAKHVNPLTLLASARGTRAFKPPEIFEDPQSDSCAGDVWALGSTLYLLLTDRLPFQELEEIDSIDPRRFERTIIPPSRLNLQVDGSLDSIVFRSLAIKVEDRYPNAERLLADLERWKPRPGGAAAEPKPSGSLQASKSALGTCSPGNEEEGRKMAIRAIELSRQPNKLFDAADLMEEAFNRWPGLRRQYEYQLKLWRRGISM